MRYATFSLNHDSGHRLGVALEGRIVELRFFAGLSIEETAEVLRISPATVKRDWVSAKAWLYREMSGRPEIES